MLKRWVSNRIGAVLCAAPLALLSLSASSASGEAGLSTESMGTYPELPVGERLVVLPVPGVVFSVFVEDLDGNGLPDIVFLHRQGEYMRSYMQTEPGHFEAAEKLEGMGFHPNGATRMPGTRPLYVVNAEGANALISVEAQKDGRLIELARSEHPPSVYSTAIQWPGKGVSLGVSRYESGIYDLLVDFDAERSEEAAYFEVPVQPSDVIGQGVAVHLDDAESPVLIVPARRESALWKISAPQGDAMPALERVWQFDEGAPRTVALHRASETSNPLLVVPLDGTHRIAFLRVIDGKLEEAGELTFPARFGPGNLTLGTDGDGALLIAADSDNEMVLYRLEPGGTLDDVRAYRFSMGVGAQYFGFHDVNADGHLDLVMGLRKREDSLVVLHGPLDRLNGELGHGISVKPVALKPSKGAPLVQVGNRVLTREHFIEQIRVGGAGHLLMTDRGREQALRMVIDEMLLDEAAYRAGIERKQLDARFFPRPSEPEGDVIAAHYQEEYEAFGIPERVHLLQIQFRINDDEAGALARAQDALARLQKGESFEALAAELTENPRSQGRGGDVGFVSRNAESWLRDALQGLAPGQQTGIVRSPAGYEILKIVDHRAALVPPLEEVRTQVSNAWRSKQQLETRQKFIALMEERIGVDRDVAEKAQ
jgi:hypothetical protein